MDGLGFGVSVLGFRLWDLGFGLWGLGLGFSICLSCLLKWM